MYTNAQIFVYQLPTPATALTGVARVNQYDTTASIFRFAQRVLYKLVPRRIRNAFRQAVVFEHPLYIQVLKGQHAEAVGQLPAFLVSKVTSSIRYSFVDTTDHLTPFCAFWCTFLSFGQFPLCFRQLVLILSKETRIGDLLAIRQGSERLKTDIHTDRGSGWRQGLRFGFDSEAGVPLSRGAASQGDRFHSAFDRPMQDQLNRADLAEDKRVAEQQRAIAILRIGDAVKAPFALEARVADLLLACLDAPKERFEGQINALGHVLQYLRVNSLQRWSFTLQQRNAALGLVPVCGSLLLFPSVLAIGQCFVIQPAAFLKHLLKKSLLALGGADTVFERFRHIVIIVRSHLTSKFVRLGLKRLKRVKPLYPTAEAGGVYGLFF